MKTSLRLPGLSALLMLLWSVVLLMPERGMAQAQEGKTEVSACRTPCDLTKDCPGCSQAEQRKQCDERCKGSADEQSAKNKWNNVWDNLKDPDKLMGVLQHSRPARTTKEIEEVFNHLEKHHGVNRKLASERLHKIKQENGLGGADNVVLDYTGNVYNPKTLELLGSLTEGGAKAIK